MSERHQDEETRKVEMDICAIIGCDLQEAGRVFDWAWRLAVARQQAGSDRARIVYMSILADVKARISHRHGPVIT